MPTYSFQCKKCSFEQDHISSISNRPDEVDCQECGSKSRRVIRVCNAQSNDPHTVKTFKKERTTGLVMHLYKCRDCSSSFDELINFTSGEHWEDSQECPECGSCNSAWVPTVKIDRFSEVFPYYDRGLGMILESKRHRREVCKQRGLTPVDGDWDVDKEFSKMDSRKEREEKEYTDYCDRLDNHPGFKQFRIAEDKGMN